MATIGQSKTHDAVLRLQQSRKGFEAVRTSQTQFELLKTAALCAAARIRLHVDAPNLVTESDKPQVMLTGIL
jgi:hypothetical protein